MIDKNFGPSEFWKYNIRHNLSKELAQDLSNFKSNEINSKIALWNPRKNGVRYIKALLYNLCATVTPENWRRISRIQQRNIGNPFTVRYHGEDICLDYLQAVFELEFMDEYTHLDDSTFLEIGAGYGRTCHAILSNHKIISYHIVDLEPCLFLAKKYLKEVLDEVDFSKVHFLTPEDFHVLDDIHFDLSINIDSFAEMDADVVIRYLKYINTHCDSFYTKNPVGKYREKSLDDHFQGSEVVSLALSTGLLCDVIDIHDEQAIEQQVPKFIKAYRPGIDWECIADSWALPWSFYWQAMYKRCTSD